MAKTHASFSIHAGDRPTVEIETHSDTSWLEIRNEAGDEVATIFLNRAMLAALKAALLDADTAQVA